MYVYQDENGQLYVGGVLKTIARPGMGLVRSIVFEAILVCELSPEEKLFGSDAELFLERCKFMGEL